MLPKYSDVDKMGRPKSKQQYAAATFVWRGINAVMSFFFILCSLVQQDLNPVKNIIILQLLQLSIVVHSGLLTAVTAFNDPDPYLWVPFYAVPACLCACIVWMPDVVENSLWKITSSLHLAISCFSFLVLIVQMVHYFREKIINPLRYEEGREMLGVVITLGWILICRCCNPKRSEQQVGQVMLMVVIVGLLPFAVWIASCLASYHHCTDMW